MNIGTILPLAHPYMSDPRFMLVTESGGLQDLIGYLTRREIAFIGYPDDITGALVEVADGDITEVWLTDSNRPYDIDRARMTRVR